MTEPPDSRLVGADRVLAVPAYLTSPTVPSGAVSVSALAYRTPLATLVDDVVAIHAIVTGQIP